MTPLETLDDHVRRPRNNGKLLNASAVGDVGSIVVGDALRYYITVQPAEDGRPERIAAAKFQVFNGADQIGAASAFTELVQGRTLDEALDLGAREVCAQLGGLPFVELPPRLWAVDGLRAAVATWRGEDVPVDEDLDPLLCRCLGIPEETVRQAIAVSGLATVDAVVAATGAGSVCGSCRVDVPRLLAPAVAAAPAGAAAAPVAGRIQLMARIQRAVESSVLPELRAAGGGLELWDFVDNRVKVRATGALAQDDAARRAALARLEAVLKAEVDPTIGVSE